MPRSGPNGTFDWNPGDGSVVANTTISPGRENSVQADVRQTFNTIQPEAYGGTGASTFAQARANLGAAAVSDIRGQIYGLTLSNNVTDATNDIDIAAGSAVDSTGAVSMPLSLPLTKRLDAAWAVGSGNGWLDTGSVANNTYHAFLIRRPDTGVVDSLASLSPTAPILPANYTQFRRIGSVIRVGGAILGFIQDGDRFSLKSLILDVNSTNPGASAVSRTLSVPSGIKVGAWVIFTMLNSGSTGSSGIISSLDVTDEEPNVGGIGQITNVANLAGNPARLSAEVYVPTNTSAQVRTRSSFSDSNVVVYVSTRGWIDTRGAN